MYHLSPSQRAAPSSDSFNSFIRLFLITLISAVFAICKTSTGKELILKSIKHCHAEFLTFLYAP